MQWIINNTLMYADSVQQDVMEQLALLMAKTFTFFIFLNGKIPFKMQFLSSKMQFLSLKQFLRQTPFKMLFWMKKCRSKCMRNGHSYSMRKPRIAPAHKEQGIWILIFPDTEKRGIYQKQLKTCFSAGNFPLAQRNFQSLNNKNAFQ